MAYTPAEIEEIKTALRVGPNYNATVLAKGRCIKLGSPHAYVFRALSKTMVKNPDCPQDLRQALLNFIATYNTPALIKRVIPFCTVHRQHDQGDRAILKVHARVDAQPLWRAMRNYLVQKGAKDFDDTITRGPMFRDIRARSLREEG
eukprot:TRINITY_DN3547_c0_g1_i1.p1 TRINITY_DN3547_c0_g1~~TRINITY_DN3547_c0_g1_i1.p1  ORF type:complete len:147 (-),score=14.67 TRINITY_DN3547_c0_g1_i1:64-504(-)